MGKACVCQCDSYYLIHHTSEATCSLRGLLQTQLRAVCLCSGHVCISACILHSASDLSPTGMTLPTKQHIYILMCIDFIHLISHVAQECKHTRTIQYNGPSNSHHGFTHSKTTRENNTLSLSHTHTYYSLLLWALEEGKAVAKWHWREAQSFRMKEDRRREERKGCTLIQLATLAWSNYFYSP